MGVSFVVWAVERCVCYVMVMFGALVHVDKKGILVLLVLLNEDGGKEEGSLTIFREM